MYTSFYGLSKKPFAVQPDPQFLWLGENHKEALSTLRYGILENKGFLLLTGEAGTGKTTLITCLEETLGDDILLAVVSDPRQERIDFYNCIAKEFGLEKTFSSKVQFLIQFSHFLHKADDDGKKVLLVVDDCHLLSQEMLEELRLLSNIEKADAKLINIFFVGQRDFNDMLVQPKNRAVRQRLTLKAELSPFSMNETEDYIRHRFSVAGGEDTILSVKSIQLVHKQAQGIPKTINLLCDKILSAGAAAGLESIENKFAAECIQDVDVEGAGSVGTHKRDNLVRPQEITTPDASGTVVNGINLEGERNWGWAKYAAGLLILAVAAGYFWSGQEQKISIPVAEPPPVVEKAEPIPEPEQPKDRFAGITNSPAVTVLGSSEEGMNAKKAEKLKSAILEKAYSSAPPAASEDLASPVQEDIVVQDNTTLPEADTAEKPSPQPVQPPVVASGADQSAPEVKGSDPVETEVLAQSASALAEGATQEAEETSALQATDVATSVSQDVKTVNTPVVSAAQPEVVVEEPPPVVASLPPMEPRLVRLPLQANSTRLTKAANRELDRFLAVLADYPHATLMVKGFVSAKTNSPENIKLSEKRADSLMKLLMKKGIDQERIEVKGMGNQEPLASNSTYEGRRKNRRVEIVVVDDGI